MFEFFDFISNSINSINNYFDIIDVYFQDFFVWLNIWYIKLKLEMSIYFLKISYHTAVALLDEIGFNYILPKLFNQLPSELRYYAHLFKVVEGLSVFLNLAATSMVMRLTK